MAGPAPQMQPGGTMVYTVDLGNGHVADIEGPPGATPEQLQAAIAEQQAAQQPAQGGVTQHNVSQEGLDPLMRHLEGLDGPDAAPEAQPDGSIKVRHADGTYNSYPNQGEYDRASFAQRFGGDTSSDAYRAAYKARFGEEPATDLGMIEGGIDPYKDQRSGVVGKADAVVRGGADTVTMGLANHAAAGIASLFNGKTFLENLRDQHAIDHSDEQNHPVLRMVGQLGGGFLVPVGADVSTGKLALQGGAYSALHGAASADTLHDAASGALTEGGLGAVTGGIIGKFGAPDLAAPYKSAKALATGDMTGRTLTPAAQAFADEGVPALPADVGGIFSRMGTGVANMTLGGIPLGEAAHRSVDAAKALRDSIAERIGSPSRDLVGRSDNLGAGQAAQRGIEASIGQGGVKQGVGEGLYSAIPIAPGASATINNSRTALAELNRGLTSNPELSKLVQDSRLLAYERAFKGETQDVPTGILDASGNMITKPVQKGGGLSWQDLKSFRSYIGELKGRQTLQDSTSQAALGRLYGALSEDMRSTAAAQGPEALAKFTRANNYWRALEQRRQAVLAPLLGKNLDLNGEAAFNQIQRWAANNTGDAFALGRALRSMPPDESAAVRATLFDRLGNVSKGRNDETGMVFSPNDFVTHWNGLSGRAKAILFPGADYRDSIDRLVTIAASQKGAQQYANISKTGNAINGAALLTGFFTNPLATLPIALGQLGFGKVMASNRFAKWLASSANKPNPVAALAHINRLSSIARAEPAIANEALGLQQRLASAFTSSPTRLAADEAPNGVGETQGNQSAPQQPQGDGEQP